MTSPIHSHANPNVGCPKSHLDKIPVEVRRMIYKYLLVNPMLATPEAIAEATEYGVNAMYELSPAILRTSSRIYQEASEVLYDQQFIIQCDYYHLGRLRDVPLEYPCPCPLLRNLVSTEPLPRSRLEIPAQSVAMTRARSWKVLVDPSNTEINRHQQFYEFCRAICDSRPKKIEVVVLKTSRERDPAMDTSGKTCMQPWETLAPLTMLRNVGKLSIRNEYPPFLHEADVDDPDTIFYESHGPGKPLSRMLQKLAQSDRATEKLTEMNSHLVKLAQTFERYTPFKLDMHFRKAADYGFWSHDENASVLKQLGYTSYLQYKQPNPYYRRSIQDSDGQPPGKNIHLEYHLSKARDATLTVQNQTFKHHRKRILKNLQSQLDRLATAARELKDFKILMIQEERQGRRTLSHFCPSWLVMIEKYAQEFERKKDFQTLAEFRRQKRRFDRLRATWPREIMLAKLDGMLEDKNFEDFKAVAEEVEDDMDKQREEMMEAMENLFNADVYPGERGCSRAKVDKGSC